MQRKTFESVLAVFAEHLEGKVNRVKLFCADCAPSTSLPAENETGKPCECCSKRASRFVENAVVCLSASQWTEIKEALKERAEMFANLAHGIPLGSDPPKDQETRASLLAWEDYTRELLAELERQLK